MPREMIDYKALAGRVKAIADGYEASAVADGLREEIADLRTVVSLLEGMAEAKPAMWAQSNHVSWAGTQPFMVRCAPSQLHPDFVPLFTRPAPQPVLSGYSDYGAAIPGIERPCTCHPDDNPPVPCARQYALSECRGASGEPTEAQIEARDALLDFIAENGTASEGVQHYLDRYVRAALAAK